MSYPPPPPQYPQYQGGDPGWQGPPPDQKQATTALVLGILGVAICALVAPFALFMGRNSLREIDASGGRLGGRGKAQAGFILGIVGTVLLAIAIVGVVALVAVGGSSGSSGGGY